MLSRRKFAACATLIYFCSDASNFVTGQTISVDGGALMR